MKPILKKILSYTAVAFLGFATGVGCLIGVSSCSVNNKDHEEIQNKQIKKNAKVSDQNSFDANKTYYIVAKNYSQNGEDVFYQDSVSPSNTAMFLDQNSATKIARADFTIIKNNDYEKTVLYFEPSLNGGVYKPSLIYFYGHGSNSYIWNWNNGLTRNNCAFVAKDFSYIDEGFLIRLFQFFDIYDLNSPFNQYTFNGTFNYNNLYQVGDTFLSRGNSGVVNAVGQTQQTKNYNLGWFYTGGLVFNQVTAYFYVTAYNYFQTHDNTWVKYESNAASNYYLYFHHMEYVNTATNYSITACNRVVMPHGNEAGWTDVYLECAWTNQDFKVIELQDDITNINTKSVFESLVSNVLGGFTEINNDIDVGLGDVFTLISSAFSAWVPIFNIQIVPGVTIGLLLFLPLITGIIIVIIWIVKR